jgi:serine/threonine protein kinase
VGVGYSRLNIMPSLKEQSCEALDIDHDRMVFFFVYLHNIFKKQRFIYDQKDQRSICHQYGTFLDVKPNVKTFHVVETPSTDSIVIYAPLAGNTTPYTTALFTKYLKEHYPEFLKVGKRHHPVWSGLKQSHSHEEQEVLKQNKIRLAVQDVIARARTHGYLFEQEEFITYNTRPKVITSGCSAKIKKRDPLQKSDYGVRSKFIASGTYGSAFLVCGDKESKVLKEAKQQSNKAKSSNTDDTDDIQSECAMMQNFNKLYIGPQCFETSVDVKNQPDYIIMSELNGTFDDLFDESDFLKDVERQPVQLGKWYAKQLIFILSQMSKQNITHCDMKCNNIAVIKEPKSSMHRLVMIDFGFAKKQFTPCADFEYTLRSLLTIRGSPKLQLLVQVIIANLLYHYPTIYPDDVYWKHTDWIYRFIWSYISLLDLQLSDTSIVKWGFNYIDRNIISSGPLFFRHRS